MSTRRRAMAVGILVLTAAGAGAADPADYRNAEDFSSEALYATRLTPTSARAMGLGGAFTAVADDPTALEYNPAGLAQIVHIQVMLGMRHEYERATFHMFDAEATATTPSTDLDQIAFAYPVPTYRGSLVVAGGIFRARSNALRSLRFDQRQEPPAFALDDEFRREQRGGLWRFSTGIATDVSRHLSVGATLSYWYGTLYDDQFRDLDEQFDLGSLRQQDRLTTRTDADGFSFDLGLLASGRHARLGLEFRSPTWLELKGDGTLEHRDLSAPTNDSNTSIFIDQQPQLPWSAAAGVSLDLGPLLVSAEARYTAWDETDVDRPAPDRLPATPPDYTAAFEPRAGAELALGPLRLRGGYAYEPLAYDLLLGNRSVRVENPRVLYAGAGISVKNVFALDAAARYGRSVRADEAEGAVFEKDELGQVLVTATYSY